MTDSSGLFAIIAIWVGLVLLGMYAERNHHGPYVCDKCGGGVIVIRSIVPTRIYHCIECGYNDSVPLMGSWAFGLEYLLFDVRKRVWNGHKIVWHKATYLEKFVICAFVSLIVLEAITKPSLQDIAYQHIHTYVWEDRLDVLSEWIVGL